MAPAMSRISHTTQLSRADYPRPTVQRVLRWTHDLDMHGVRWGWYTGPPLRLDCRVLAGPAAVRYGDHRAPKSSRQSTRGVHPCLGLAGLTGCRILSWSTPRRSARLCFPTLACSHLPSRTTGYAESRICKRAFIYVVRVAISLLQVSDHSSPAPGVAVTLWAMRCVMRVERPGLPADVGRVCV
jgi:hypothetical protein